MSDFQTGTISGILIGVFVGVFGLLAFIAFVGTSPRDVYTEVCETVFQAEYVPELGACLNGDTIVHRYK